MLGLPAHIGGGRRILASLNASLAPAGSSVSAGRRAVCTELAARGVARELIDVVELMASELLTNAVLHAQGGIRLVLAVDDDVVRVEVRDESPGQPLLRCPPGDATSGRGIGIVDALASRWGVEPVPGGGKSVWFEVRR
jgi:anti-sigma regulatory factor (Ser/Thr protein kinase)